MPDIKEWLVALQEIFPELKREHANIYRVIKNKFLELEKMILSQALSINNMEENLRKYNAKKEPEPPNHPSFPDCKKCVVFLAVGGKNFGSNVLCENCPTAKIEKEAKNHG